MRMKWTQHQLPQQLQQLPQLQPLLLLLQQQLEGLDDDHQTEVVDQAILILL